MHLVLKYMRLCPFTASDVVVSVLQELRLVTRQHKTSPERFRFNSFRSTGDCFLL